MIPPVPPPIPPEAYPAPQPASGGAKKWILFGCGGCLGLMILGGVAVIAFIYFVFGAMKKSDVFVEAVKRAQNSAEVQAAIGTPIETGWMLQGSFNYQNDSGTASFNVPLKGPKGEATLIAEGEKVAGGPWFYRRLETVLPDGTKVNLAPLPKLEPDTALEKSE